jgi:hypothetical protein
LLRSFGFARYGKDQPPLCPASCDFDDFFPLGALAQPMRVTLYKDPSCPCCEGHANYLNNNGFSVEIVPTIDLPAMYAKAQVPPELHGCHIITVDTYLVIGHVPVEPIRKLLTERPRIVGISIPAMPVGLPGMEGPRSGPIAVYEIVPGAGRTRVFMNV